MRDADVCGNPTFAGPDLFTYADLINGGYLNTNGSAAEGIHYTFDECSKTVSCLLIIFTSLLTRLALCL